MQNHRTTLTDSSKLPSSNSQVLVVGAGPTGLVLALWLAKSGVRPHIIDKSDGPGQASRAMAVQSRTLEFYSQLGIADEVIAAGLKMDRATVRRNGRAVARIPIGDIGTGLSPYPFALSYPQDHHERLLLRHLQAAGVDVDWNTELMSLRQTNEQVHAVIQADDQDTQLKFDYVCGCDGGHSRVRHELGIGFPGGTYAQRFYVADADVLGEANDGGINICAGDQRICAILPIRNQSSCRLIGIVPPKVAEKPNVKFDDIRDDVSRISGLQIADIHWFSTYDVHHRVADHFADGRVFIAGDAGHVHSPAGGQGMNTGIGDAINLAWKLVAVIRDGADPAILNTYETERIDFARILVKTTDQVFANAVGKGLRGRLLRGFLVPALAPLVTRLNFVRRLVFGFVSQIRINYRNSPMSIASTSQTKLRVGDRLPWVTELENHRPLTSREWQIHFYGSAGETTTTAFENLGFPIFRFPWVPSAGSQGFHRGAAYLVRPDGHISLIDDSSDPTRIKDFAAKYRLAPKPPRTSTVAPQDS